MSREQFIDNLRIASRMFAKPTVLGNRTHADDANVAGLMHRADLWLTSKSVEGFDPADFADLAHREREELIREIAGFRDIASTVPANQPATKSQSNRARKHLERVIAIVRDQLVREWVAAQKDMMQRAKAAAEKEGWFAAMDDKVVLENLLGSYTAPRLRIKTPDTEVVLDPVARFGSGRQGVVDLVVMPAYETMYLVAYKHGTWQIISTQGAAARSKPFTPAALVSTITNLS